MQISGQQVSKPQIALRRKRENCPFCRALDDHHSLSEWWAIQKKNPKPSCNIKGTESTVSSHRHFGHVNLLYSLFPRCRCNCWEKKKKKKEEWKKMQLFVWRTPKLQTVRKPDSYMYREHDSVYENWTAQKSWVPVKALKTHGMIMLWWGY